MFIINKLRVSYTQIIALGTLVLILAGSLLLCLPVSSKSGEPTPFIDSLFTAASATCVTGLIIYDTYTHWSTFGQIVIITLIQIGGIGFMTIIAFFSLFLKKKIGLRERRLLMESANTMKIGGVVLLVKKILTGTFIFESIGAIILTIRFYPEMGLKSSLYNGVFHSISAFCNAGFDIMGKYGEFSSLTYYSADAIVNITIMSLIIIGGLGFIVWEDIGEHHLCCKKYHLHTKIVLLTTFILVFGGALLFYLFERNGNMAGMPFKEAVLASLFQSVTPRTAGFNTIDMAKLSDSGSFLTIILMFIGGSPGSTAGGIKTTTLAVLILSALSSAKGTSDVSIFKRRLEDGAVKRAGSIVIIYIIVTFTATLVICSTQLFSLKETLFEVYSAAGTVGLTMGLTPHLNSLSKIIITFLMYCGKVGSLSMALVFAEKKEIVPISRPAEKIIIG